MKKFNFFLDTVMRFIMAAAMFALLAGGTWQIFTRWILKNPSTFTDEFLRDVLIWASMLGAGFGKGSCERIGTPCPYDFH